VYKGAATLTAGELNCRCRYRSEVIDVTLDDPDYNLGFLGFGVPDEYPPERVKHGTLELATFLKRNGMNSVCDVPNVFVHRY